ncbi:MAG: L-2-hydroxyglutarate oxidase [Taibaiella sp.]|nr:L-2-hydroxyglutarate oxidase [Taibaiella sp.]
MTKTYGIIGGGIIGLATAYKLLKRFPDATVILFEKESTVGRHQSGNNSGVLHCGLYYQPGSLKARLSVEGLREMADFCKTYQIPHDICGKVVVATTDAEEEALEELMKRGAANGLEGLRFLDEQELREREPYVWAQKALLVPQEGIVDYKAVMRQLSQLIQERGGSIRCGVRIDGIKDMGGKVWLSNGIEEWVVDTLICCAGLHADRLYEAATGLKSPVKIVPFRGEYMELVPEAGHMVSHLVYPVPDAQYPFLGVHFTRMVDGRREVGPNAVLAARREGYSFAQISLRDTFDALSYKGLWRFLSNNLMFSLGELQSSIQPALFLKKARKLIPEISLKDLKKGNAGVRAQAMEPDGQLIMDFRILRRGAQVHILNAPSPGATASLAIADYILDEYVVSHS